MMRVKFTFDKDEEQAWLNDYARQGWAMVSFFAGLVTFVPCEPGEFKRQHPQEHGPDAPVHGGKGGGVGVDLKGPVCRALSQVHPPRPAFDDLHAGTCVWTAWYYSAPCLRRPSPPSEAVWTDKTKGGSSMNRFQKVYSQGAIDVMEIWVDTETGVNYVFHRNGNAAGFTPLLDRPSPRPRPGGWWSCPRRCGR